MLDSKEIGKRIKERQLALGMKQKDITEKSGISKAAISNYISGLRVPDTETLYKLSLVLETSMEWLLIGRSTNENYTEDEKQILEAYRIAAPAIQTATKKLLDIPEPEPKLEKSPTSRTG